MYRNDTHTMYADRDAARATRAKPYAVAQVTMSLDEKLIMTNDAYGTVEVQWNSDQPPGRQKAR